MKKCDTVSLDDVVTYNNYPVALRQALTHRRVHMVGENKLEDED